MGSAPSAAAARIEGSERTPTQHSNEEFSVRRQFRGLSFANATGKSGTESGAEGLSIRVLRELSRDVRVAGTTYGGARAVLQRVTGGSFPTYASFAASRSRADVQPATTVLLASPSSDLATLLSSAADFLEAKHGRTDAEESEFVWLEMLCLPPHSLDDSWFSSGGGFRDIVSKAHCVIVWLAPFEKLSLLKDMKSLWELQTAAQEKTQLAVLAGTVDDELRFLQKLTTGFRECLAAITSVSLAQATPLSPADQKRVLAAMGVKNPNDTAAAEAAVAPIIDSLRHWMLRRTRTALSALSDKDRALCPLITDLAQQLSKDPKTLKEASELYQYAAEGRAAHLGRSHLGSLTASVHLGSALVGLGSAKAGSAHIHAALAELERTVGPGHEATLEARRAEARALQALGEHARAVAELRAALVASREHKGNLTAVTLEVQSELAVMLAAERSDDAALAEAEALLRQVLGALSAQGGGGGSSGGGSGGPAAAAAAAAAGGRSGAKTMRVLAALTGVLVGQGKTEEALHEVLSRAPDLTVRGAAICGAALLDLSSALADGGSLRDAKTILETVLHALRSDAAFVVATCGPQTVMGLFWLLGQVLGDLGELPRAEEVLREGLTFAWGMHGKAHEAALQTLRHLAVVLHEQGKLAEAEQLLRHVVERLQTETAGPREALLLEASADLALLLSDCGRLREAEELLQDILHLTEREADPARLATALGAGSNLSALLVKAGRPLAAAAQAQRTLELASAALGPASGVTLTLKETLARARLDRGLLREAEEGLREVLAVRNAAHMQDSPLAAPLSQAPAKQLLGRVLQARGLYAEAEELLLEALGTLKGLKGGGGAATLEALAQVGDLLRERGQLQESAKLLTRVAAKWQAMPRAASGPPATRSVTVVAASASAANKPPPGTTGAHSELLAAQYLGRALHELGDLPAAENSLRSVWARLGDAAGGSHPLTLLAASDLAAVLADAGQAEEAAALLQEAIPGLVEALSDARPDVLLAQGTLALAVAGADPARAAKAAAEAQARAARLLGPRHPAALRLRVVQGQVHLLGGDDPAGARVLREACEGMRSALGVGHPRLVQASALLVPALRRLGAIAEADGLRASMNAVMCVLPGPAPGSTPRGRGGGGGGGASGSHGSSSSGMLSNDQLSPLRTPGRGGRGALLAAAASPLANSGGSTPGGGPDSVMRSDGSGTANSGPLLWPQTPSPAAGAGGASILSAGSRSAGSPGPSSPLARGGGQAHQPAQHWAEAGNNGAQHHQGPMRGSGAGANAVGSPPGGWFNSDGAPPVLQPCLRGSKPAPPRVFGGGRSPGGGGLAAGGHVSGSGSSDAPSSRSGAHDGVGHAYPVLLSAVGASPSIWDTQPLVEHTTNKLLAAKQQQ